MLIVAIGWIYVVLLMAVARGAVAAGHRAGARCCTLFVLLRRAPLAVVLYVMGAPARRAPAASGRAASRGRVSAGPDAGGHAPGDAVAPERKEP